MRPNTKMSSGQATFDLKAAREAMARATERPNVTTDIYHLAALTYLPAALDEIERLRAREKEFVLASSKRTQFALDTAKFWIDQYERQAKRIAELEEENRQLVRQILTDDDKDRLIAKQRTVLKKLGQAKRERGKALVEERAKTTGALLCEYADEELHCDEREMWCDWDSCTINNKARQKIREQLRREGKL